MSLRKDMTFCWRRFRHFVAAYFALGLAATVTHSAIVLASLDVIASEEEPVAIVQEVPAPVVEEAPVEEIVEPVDGSVEEAPIETEVSLDGEPAVEASEGSEAEPSEEIVENTEGTETEVPAEGEQPAEPSEETPVEEPAVTEEAPVDSETPVEESTPTDATEETPSDSETPVTDSGAEEVEQAPVQEQPLESEDPAPDSWPEERITPVVEEEYELPPYSEARSTIEAVAPKLDWMYTLRAGAQFTQISVTKLATTTDLNALVQLLESNGQNSSINSIFCEIEDDLTALEELYAPGSDDTQPQVDADNQEIIDEIGLAVSQVRDTWLLESGSSYQCN
jgi:hypothetical protein